MLNSNVERKKVEISKKKKKKKSTYNIKNKVDISFGTSQILFHKSTEEIDWELHAATPQFCMASVYHMSPYAAAPWDLCRGIACVSNDAWAQHL